MTEDQRSILRVPPHSMEAEQAVLGCLMLSTKQWGEVEAVLEAGDFYRHEHRIIFSAIASLASAHREVDLITVHDRIGDKDAVSLAYLNGLCGSVMGSGGVLRYAKIVADRAQARRLIALCDEASTAAWGEGDANERADRVAALLAGFERRSVGIEPVLLAEAIRQRIDRYSDIAEGNIAPGWPLGIGALDDILGGGLRPGGLYILAARPGVGKSSLAQQFALHVAGAGLTSLFLSQEMPIGEVADRAIAHLGRMDYGGLSVGRVDNWDALTEAGHAAVKLPMWLDDEGALTLRKVQHKARSVRGLQVLVVDYLQLMQSDGKADGNRNAEIEAISRGLKALAKQFGMAVVVLSQLNRQVEQRTNKRPVLADLRDSGAIEQDADVVLMLWPHRDLDRGQRVVGAAVAKNRQGRQGEVALHFDGTRQRWGASTESLASDDGPKTKGRSL